MKALSQTRHLVFASPMTHREQLVKEVSARLLEVGIRVYPPTFPYGNHHEYYRTRIRPDGKHARRSEIARMLEEWSKSREEADDYVWQGVCGGLLAYFEKSPLHRVKLPEDIAGRMEIIRWGDDFADFASARISRPA